MIEIVKVARVHPEGDYRLRLVFTNGEVGVRDFADLIAEGGIMVEPLADLTYFARVFVQCGVPSWPNGFDIDAIALYQDMSDAGLLRISENVAD